MRNVEAIWNVSRTRKQILSSGTHPWSVLPRNGTINPRRASHSYMGNIYPSRSIRGICVLPYLPGSCRVELFPRLGNPHLRRWPMTTFLEDILAVCTQTLDFLLNLSESQILMIALAVSTFFPPDDVPNHPCQIHVIQADRANHSHRNCSDRSLCSRNTHNRGIHDNGRYCFHDLAYFFGVYTMNYPHIPDPPRIRCCNCISWTPGHSRLFGRCTAHKTTCYINGSCPDWIWDATA